MEEKEEQQQPRQQQSLCTLLRLFSNNHLHFWDKLLIIKLKLYRNYLLTRINLAKFLNNMHLGRYARKRESDGPEFWNSLSNLPFIFIGLLRVFFDDFGNSSNDDQFFTLYYSIYTCIGIGSFIHHATNPQHPWILRIKRRFPKIHDPTLIIDYIPIVTFTICVLWFESFTVFSRLQWATWFKICLSLGVGINDHIVTTIPVPWGHSFWHVLAAFTVDGILQDLLYIH
jgi:hypothetical protein